MWKGTYLCKTKTISFSRLQRAHESHEYVTSNELLNLATIFVTLIKLTTFFFLLQYISPTYLKLWDIAWLMFKKLKMHWMSRIWVKFIVLWIFQSLKNCNYLKSLFKDKNDFLKTNFLELLKCLITSWIEIGNEKYINFSNI